MQDDHSAENVFGKIAELYDDVRPEYPQQLVTEVLEWSRLPEQGRILEVGCGTGKATRMFATHGYSLTGVDPAPGMLQVARRTCVGYANTGFVEAKFEDWSLPEEPFDLVYSAQAFHWIDPTVGPIQVAKALRTGGTFALFWHDSDHEESPLRTALDNAYTTFAPDLNSPAPGVHNTSRWSILVNDSGLFTDIEHREYGWQAEYNADTWVRLLQTHSDHRVLPPEQLSRLLTAVREAIETHGGVYRYPVVTRLLLSRKA